MQRAHTARVRFDPAGPARDALATFEIANWADALEDLASSCPSSGLLDWSDLIRRSEAGS